MLTETTSALRLSTIGRPVSSSTSPRTDGTITYWVCSCLAWLA